MGDASSLYKISAHKQGGQAMTIEPHLMLTDDPKVSGYPTKDAAFDAACDAAKAVLSELGV